MAGALSISLEGRFNGFLQSLMAAGTMTERQVQRMSNDMRSLTRYVQEQEKAQRAATAAAADQAKATQSQARLMESAKAAGLSVGQMNNALRNTPAQLTDIVTQLAGGQSPFLIMIQQGGQMRDMFGGFNGMFHGLATIITPARLAMGGLAGATGSLLYAYMQGRTEQEAFNKAMMLSGGFAGQTSASFAAMAAQVSKSTNATVGAARDIGTALVQTGRVGPDQLAPMGTAIAHLQSLSGESSEALVKDFARMRDGVAKWAEEHNKQYHFLTLAEYKQIAAAERAGDVNKAMGITLSALNGRLKESKTWWDSLTQSVGSYWDSLKKSAGPATDEDKVSGLRGQLNALRNRPGGDTYSSYRQQVVTVAQQRELIQGQIKALQDKVIAERASADAAAASQAKQEKAIGEQVKADDRAKQSSARLKSAFESTSKSLQEEAAKANAQTESWKRYGKQLDESREAVIRFRTTQGDLKSLSPSRKRALLADGKSDDAALQAEIAAKEDAQARQRVEALEAESRARQQSAREMVIEQKSRAALGQSVDAELKSRARFAAGSAYDKERAEALAKSLAEHTASIDKEVASLQVEGSLLGKTTLERDIAIKQIQIHAQTEALLAQHAERSGEILDWEASQIAKVTKALQDRAAMEKNPQTGVDRAVARYKEDAANVAKYTENMVSGGLSRMEDAVVSFVHTGKLSFGSLWEFMADEFIRQQLRMVVAGNSSGTGGVLGLFASLGKASGGGSSGGASPAPFSEVPISAATGYDYVQKDNAPFLLHKGERVLTAAENRDYNGGGGSPSIVQHISIGAGVNRAEVMAAIAQSMEAVKGQILSSKMHRGAFS